MSFEGYYQRICEAGHYDEYPLYGEDYLSPCEDCGAPVSEHNLVDETNGCDMHLDLAGAPCSCGEREVVCIGGDGTMFRFGRVCGGYALDSGSCLKFWADWS